MEFQLLHSFSYLQRIIDRHFHVKHCRGSRLKFTLEISHSQTAIFKKNSNFLFVLPPFLYLYMIPYYLQLLVSGITNLLVSVSCSMTSFDTSFSNAWFDSNAAPCKSGYEASGVCESVICNHLPRNTPTWNLFLFKKYDRVMYKWLNGNGPGTLSILVVNAFHLIFRGAKFTRFWYKNGYPEVGESQWCTKGNFPPPPWRGKA